MSLERVLHETNLSKKRKFTLTVLGMYSVFERRKKSLESTYCNFSKELSFGNWYEIWLRNVKLILREIRDYFLLLLLNKNNDLIYLLIAYQMFALMPSRDCFW